MNNKNKMDIPSYSWDTLWINANIATCQPNSANASLLKKAAMAIKDGKIAWIGLMQALPALPHNELAKKMVDIKNQLITPALIDCHTHLVYAGSRSHEFEMRLHGKSYEEIAKMGGGIISTVRATRQASEEELLAQSLQRAHAFLKEGVLTLEVKSGYGLDLATELKILRVAKRIEKYLPLQVVTTFLGAHAIPPEYQNNVDAYVDLICEEMIPAVASENLAACVDVFCEKIAFSLDQTRKIFKAASKHNLAIKCHAEQLSNLGASKLAAEFSALSVDHLEFCDEASIKAIAEAGATAVLLPGAFYFLREKQLPPIDLLRQYQVPMAIATDCNPGTSPTTSLQLMLNMACTLFKLTPEETLAGVTHHAAKAIGLNYLKGTLTVGASADFLLWDVQDPAELSYYFGGNRLKQIFKNGQLLTTSES